MLAMTYLEYYCKYMAHHDHDPAPSEHSLFELSFRAFAEASGDKKDWFELETGKDRFDLPFEQITYHTESGRVRMYRPSLDVLELRAFDQDPHSKSPLATININANRPYTLYLANGERYHAATGFCEVGIFDDGVFLDRMATSYFTSKDNFGVESSVLGGSGHMYAPLTVESDWFIQSLIDPDKAISHSNR